MDDDLDFDIPSVEDLQKEEYASDIHRNDNDASMNILAQGAVLKGNINVDGELKIYGKVIGDIISSSGVFIGETGVVEGNVKSAGMEVSGTFRGNAEVSGEFLVSSTGRIFGDLVIGTLNVNAGAMMRGKILMNIPEPVVPEMVPVDFEPAEDAIPEHNGHAARS
ncbi:polymer-forming cytoskeletal protein [Chlorobium sp. N1]|uniref:bactofilin family protein n=1 Tax=Chlorobium sp. N1 TaxID=2491138 RepID=UPI00103FA149|nr:polymer-forming cytoskeletal protein [Chlorobium sp. N1]TCD47126.1 polymer-forming cytoskeletal protein [Chlorobium sp. N1]